MDEALGVEGGVEGATEVVVVVVGEGDTLVVVDTGLVAALEGVALGLEASEVGVVPQDALLVAVSAVEGLVAGDDLAVAVVGGILAGGIRTTVGGRGVVGVVGAVRGRSISNDRGAPGGCQRKDPRRPMHLQRLNGTNLTTRALVTTYGCTAAPWGEGLRNILIAPRGSGGGRPRSNSDDSVAMVHDPSAMLFPRECCYIAPPTPADASGPGEGLVRVPWMPSWLNATRACTRDWILPGLHGPARSGPITLRWMRIVRVVAASRSRCRMRKNLGDRPTDDGRCGWEHV